MSIGEVNYVEHTLAHLDEAFHGANRFDLPVRRSPEYRALSWPCINGDATSAGVLDAIHLIAGTLSAIRFKVSDKFLVVVHPVIALVTRSLRFLGDLRDRSFGG